MAIPARRLPIVGPCPHRASVVPTGAARLWCSGCETVVHDLGAMREREVRRLLARNVGRSICVTYRARSDGSVAMMPERAPRWIASSAAVALGGCIGHLEAEELQAPEDCVDAIGCGEIDELAVIPVAREEGEPDALEPEARVRRQGSRLVPRGKVAPETLERAAEHEPRDPNGERGTQPRAAADDATGAARGAVSVRVDFEIDSDVPDFRGMIIIADEWYREDGRLRFLPTRQIFAELRDRLRSRRR